MRHWIAECHAHAGPQRRSSAFPDPEIAAADCPGRVVRDFPQV